MTFMQDYCYYLGVLGSAFLFWLGILVLIGSDTMYIHIHSKLESLIALWFAALLWAGVSAYISFSQKNPTENKDQLQNWIEQQKKEIDNVVGKEIEMK